MSVTAAPPVSPAAAAGAPTPAGESCPLCGAPLGSEQEWCLSCGGAARTRLAAIPNWRAPLAALGLTIVLALGGLTAALVSLAGESGSSVASTVPVTRTVVVPAGAPTSAAPATPGAASPPATTPTTGAPGVSTPGAAVPGATPGATAPGATATTSPSSPGATTGAGSTSGAAGSPGAHTGSTATTPTSAIPALGGVGNSPKGKAALERLERAARSHQNRAAGTPAG